MQPSKYLKTFEADERKDKMLLFSALHCSKIVITKKIWEAMGTGDLTPEEETILLRTGMLVKDRDEEKKTVSGLFKELEKKYTKLDIIAVLNLDCNFACRYCIEGAMKGRLYMSEGTAERFIDFIKKQFTEDKRALHVDFYGGEPLLSLGLIRKISNQLNQFAEGKKVPFTFGLVTNGSLFKKETAEELVRLGLKYVKITIDGPPHIHNKNRPFKSGAASFDTLIGNIRDTCGLVKIAVGGNFERDNYKEFPGLLDYLIDEGLTPDKLVQIKFDPVVKKSDRVLSPMEFNDGCISFNEPWIAEAYLFLREEILKRGYRVPAVRPSFCSIEAPDSFVINYEGTLYKCPGFLGMKEFSAGDIETGVIDYSSIYRTGIWDNEKCLDCTYLPLCFGGCRFSKFISDGKIGSPDCQKNYFDACLETLVKQDIKYGLRVDK
jgi:uncharacterized protein